MCVAPQMPMLYLAIMHIHNYSVMSCTANSEEFAEHPFARMELYLYTGRMYVYSSYIKLYLYCMQ